MRSPAKITATALLILATTITYIPVAEGANYYPAETKFWVDCSSGFRTTDCIESVEYSDPASEKRDANGFLDYTSIVWKKQLQFQIRVSNIRKFRIKVFLRATKYQSFVLERTQLMNFFMMFVMSQRTYSRWYRHNLPTHG